MRFVSVLVVVVTALALYASRAVLDQIVTNGGPVRVALLPPWQSLGGFLAVGILGLVWLNRLAVRRGTATAVRPPLGSLLLPLLGLLLLLLPYLPMLPDIVPGLQILAGPVRGVVWLVVISQLCWILWQERLIRADWLRSATVRQLAIGVGIATALLTGAAAARFSNTVLYPAGDEPHYLILAQSVWRDGDLKIENNHARGDYREYFTRELDPHYLTRGVDREIYSIHPVGMPVLIAPILAIGGYPGVVFVFVVIASVAAALMWHSVVRSTNDVGAATFAAAAVVATSPFLFNAFAIYPEIPAALAVTVGFHRVTAPMALGVGRWLSVGIVCAALPWFSTKYAPMSAALVAIALARLAYPPGATGASGATGAGAGAAAALVVPYGLSLLGWFYFFYATWGSPMPQAPYGALVQTDLKNLVFGAPGLLFDQEYGVLPYAPVYLLAGTGLWTMWRGDRESRRLAVEIAIIFAALLGTVGAFRIWWGGSAAPGRPLTSGLLLLAMPIAFAMRAGAAGSARRAAQHLLLWASVGVAGVLFFSQNGFLTANGRDGTSALLEFLSPRWPAWTLVPSFIYHESWTALGHTVVWLVLLTLAAIVIARNRSGHPGAASLWAITVASIAILIAIVLMPHLPVTPLWPVSDARARARLPLLDEFDKVTRPIALLYTPLDRVEPSTLLPHATVEVEPGLRTEPQPIRVVHNGRFSLPAGSYRIEVDWTGPRSGETIGLQLGRTGDVWQSWPIEPRQGESWDMEFTIPVDVPFVGLRGTPELEQVIKHVRFVPVRIFDRTRRPRVGEVIGASRSGGASLYYHDADAFPEQEGFWVQGGGRRTRVSIDRRERPLMLRVHSGPIGNALHLSTSGWQRTVALQPDEPLDIEVPGAGDGLVTLTLSTDAAFVPHERDPQSTDVRPLGVWIEVVQ